MSHYRQHGVMLIELMLGLVIGLLTALAIVQVLGVAEAQRRTTTAGSDAQVNGAVALHLLQRDIRQAGYGLLANPTALGCTVRAQYNGWAGARNLTLAPVVISATGDAAGSVSLQLFSSANTNPSVPVLVTGTHLQTATSFDVKSSFSVFPGDLMVAVPAAWNATNTCTLFAVSGVTTGALPTIVHAVGNNWNTNQATLMPAGGYVANADPAQSSYLLNLGSSFTYRTYAINNGVLQVTNLDSATGASSTLDAYSQVVNLRALYGKDTDGDGVVDTFDTVTPTTNLGWLQVLAVRVALVVRSSEYEKNVVTGAAPQWNVGTVATIAGRVACVDGTGAGCLPINVAYLGADWDHYRYKIFDTLIPLRNVLWNR